MDDRRHGEVDLDDIVYAKNYLASLDWVDGERIGIIGGSYGGYMVGAALAFRPGVFKAGINIFGVMNWGAHAGIHPTLVGRQPQGAVRRTRRSRSGRRTLAPYLTALSCREHHNPDVGDQGANDPRVLQVESDEIVEAVRANGTPVDYIVFPDEGHGFSRRENRIAASEAFVRFLKLHL